MYFEAKSTANQSISTDTETLLTWPTVVTNDSGFIVSGKIVIPFEGQAMIGIKAKIASSAAGSFRKLCVRVYDPGAEAGGYADYSKRYEYEENLAPSVDTRFCLWDFTTGPYDLHMGCEVRVYVEHDAGSSLNIINATLNSLITITNIIR